MRSSNLIKSSTSLIKKNIFATSKFSFSVLSKPQDAVKAMKDHGVEMVDWKFTDFHGKWQHIQMSAEEVGEGHFTDGFGFDGSSIAGWQSIDKSDMALIPDLKTFKMDPFAKYKTATFICDVYDPIEDSSYSRDPRNIVKKGMEYLKSTGVADQCRIGPEAEFFMFDKVSYGAQPGSAHFNLESNEASINSHIPFSDGYKIGPKQGYFPVRPWDKFEDIRSEMVRQLIALGIHTEASHHEVGGFGQQEIDIRFDNILDVADSIQWYKYVIRNIANKHGYLVTFMPKPIAEDNGSGMHTHVSLHGKDGKNFFTGDKYAGLSDMALYFIGGLIKHSRAVSAFTNPTINSFKRLVPGFEAPVTMVYSNRNRSAAIRIPLSSAKAKRLEFRAPDPSANPYLAFTAIMMAGLDGIQNKISPGDPFEQDIYALTDAEAKKLPVLPNSLEDAINALEEDSKFLQKGDVFTQDMLDMWITRKRELEIAPFRKYVTAHDFIHYIDC